MASSSLVFGYDDVPGIRRRGQRRVRYEDEATGKVVTDPETLERIKHLAVPPAWTDVWISADANAHLQATGRDAKGRKQYRYHVEFRAERETTKFGQLIGFGHALGAIRARVDDDLARTGLPRERVVALVVRLLEETYIRVGNEEYAKTNDSYGLTTLRDHHADIDGGRLHLEFRAKSGKMRALTLADRRMARLVKRCQDLPGQVLFQYVEDDEVRAVHSSDVNEYLREATGLDVTAKTFRTWGGTVLAAGTLALAEEQGLEPRKAVLKETIVQVSQRLGNTPAVCRRSYIHPRVMEAYEAGELLPAWRSGPARPGYGLAVEERRLLAVLEDERLASGLAG
jgi:DNA topoisomerase-1